MKPDELDLLHGHLNGTLSEADFGRLQALLRTNAEARRTLRALATVDAKLQALGSLNTMPTRPLSTPAPARARPLYQRLAWSSMAAAAACVALALTGTLFTRVKSSPSRPDLAAEISSSQNSIGRLSVKPPSLFPAWASPTAALLDQPRIPQ
ncbi:MAG: hypothetical protein ABSH48_07925 [Verrucomicrobiota bacterium]|jgi:ferric-dicitrate binding protein FerR (iron transport regulator)